MVHVGWKMLFSFSISYCYHGGKSKGTTCAVDRDDTEYITVDLVLRLSTEYYGCLYGQYTCFSTYRALKTKDDTVMIQSFRTDRSGQKVQTQIRLLLNEQSDQGLHCLLFHLRLFDEIP